MNTNRNSTVYGLLLAAWVAIVAWQIVEHDRVKESARVALLNRARDISNSLSVVIRSQRRFGGIISEQRLEAALEDLVESEELLSVALLALIAVGISAPYISGFQALSVQVEHMLLDSHLRSQMEYMVSTEFDALANGSSVVTVRGKNYTITWTVVNVDLDGDAILEDTAKQVTVFISELPHRSLSMILVDTEGQVGKIS